MFQRDEHTQLCEKFRLSPEAAALHMKRMSTHQYARHELTGSSGALSVEQSMHESLAWINSPQWLHYSDVPGWIYDDTGIDQANWQSDGYAPQAGLLKCYGTAAQG
jgi:hypothetical protein